MKIHTSFIQLASIAILGSLLLSSCRCRDTEVIDTFQLSDSDKSWIPYQDNVEIAFQHSEGYLFSIETTEQTRLNSNQDECVDYYLFESLLVNLNSEIPRLDINLQLNKTSEEEEAFFSISADRTYFFNDASTPNSSLEIEGVIFDNVFSYTSDDSSFYISEILYTTATGILRINYKDQSYVQIVP